MADTSGAGEGVLKSSRTAQQPGLTPALWNFFSEMKTAIVLLLLLALFSILGTIIVQNASPEEYLARYGSKLYALIKYLGLNNVYSSILYKFLLALVGINLTVCSINRFSATWNRTFHPDPGADAGQISKMRLHETLTCDGSISDAAERVTEALRGRSYHVVQKTDGESVTIFASRGRLSLWGPYLTHLSLLVIFLGAILGSMLGFNGFTSIGEGKTISAYYDERAQTRKDLGFKVALERFEIGHDKKRNPTAYKSDLLVYEGNRVAARKTIDVNHPLTYKGVSFFQSDYGLSGMVVKLTGPDGQSTRLNFDLSTENGPHGKTYSVAGEPFKQVQVGGKTLTIFVHNMLPDYGGKHNTTMSSLPLNPAARIMVNDRLPAYKGLDAWKDLGWMTEGESAGHKGFTVKLDDIANYTGLQVSRNPGLPVIYAGFGLLLAGVFLSFYMLHRIIRLRITANGRRVSVLAGATCREDASVFGADFQRIRSALS